MTPKQASKLLPGTIVKRTIANSEFIGTLRNVTIRPAGIGWMIDWQNGAVGLEFVPMTDFGDIQIY